MVGISILEVTEYYSVTATIFNMSKTAFAPLVGNDPAPAVLVSRTALCYKGIGVAHKGVAL